MRFIGITGQVGSGKSEVLKQLQEKYNCRIILADNVAHEVREPGGECYEKIVELIGTESLNEDGTINRQKMAAIIFSDKAVLKKVNELIHPAVKNRILEIYSEEKEKGEIDYLFLEAALLLDDGYDRICDELWFIYVRDEVRRERLKASRGYSDEKIDSILKGQRSEAQFRQACKWTIDNSDEIELTMEQIGLILS